MKQLVFRTLQLFHGKKVQGFLHIHPIGGADVQGTVETWNYPQTSACPSQGSCRSYCSWWCFWWPFCLLLPYRGWQGSRQKHHQCRSAPHWCFTIHIIAKKYGNMFNPCWQISSGLTVPTKNRPCWHLAGVVHGLKPMSWTGGMHRHPWRILTVLLYMVLHGSHQYTPFMLANKYQHHGSVMGHKFWDWMLLLYLFFFRVR